MKAGLHALFAATVAMSMAIPNPSTAQDQPAVAKSKHYKHRAQTPGEATSRRSDFTGQIPNSCDYDRAAGRCMIDLGYGRCMECSSGPFK